MILKIRGGGGEGGYTLFPRLRLFMVPDWDSICHLLDKF